MITESKLWLPVQGEGRRVLAKGRREPCRETGMLYSMIVVVTKPCASVGFIEVPMEN